MADAQTAAAKPKATPKKKINYKSPPNDFTGRRREEQEAEHEDELKAREREIALAASPVAPDYEFSDNGEIIDMSEGPVDQVVQPEESVESTNEDIVEMVGESTHTIRVNAPAEVTIGYGNFYRFEPGKRYKVQHHVYVWLEEHGLVYH